MDSRALKTEGMCWLRFFKRVDIIATEVGLWNADVLGISDASSIEIETKISKSDLLADFSKKKAKHFLYQDGHKDAPNYFYFLVPPDLVDYAKKVVKEKGPKYGVMTMSQPPYYKPGERLYCVQKPQKLHAYKPTERMRQIALQRMGSELCRFHITFDKLRPKEIAELQIEETKKEILAAIQSTQHISFEDDIEYHI